VVRVAGGNFLEMYDFQVFGYHAAAIARTFFPTGNESASLMLSLATFGTGFLMRPLGAIMLGAYVGRLGTSQPKRNVALKAPASCATMNSGASAGRIPANVSDNDLAMVTAGLANDVDAVNQ
jgi:MFS family permease